MRTVFFGTPDWAVPSLEALLASDIDVAGVVTNPDRPAGRGMKERPSPVKVAALAAGLEVTQPQRARDEELFRWLEAKEPDVAVVVAYGKILPAPLLELPARGFVNVHFSLLPLYRGAAPVQRALMDGRKETGVSIMQLTEGMDEGPVFAVARVAVPGDATAGEVGERLARMGADLLVETLVGIEDGSARSTEQDHSAATYAPKITTEEARIDWTRSAAVVRDLVRALNPAPGAWTVLGDTRLKVLTVAPVEGSQIPGHATLARSGIAVGTGAGDVALLEVQPAGKRAMAGADFARGLRPEGELVFGP